MKKIFIGDVHGCYDELILLVEKLNINKNDEVIFVGDLINKGDKSFEVLKFVYENNYLSVWGNHELKFFAWREGTFKAKYPGQQEAFQVLNDKLLSSPQIDKWLYSLPCFIEKDDFVVVHAGFTPDENLKEQSSDVLTTIREYQNKPWHSFYDGDKIIVYGHWAQQGLHIDNKTIGLDSGCVYGNFLSAYVLEEKFFLASKDFHNKNIIQQKALKTYCVIK